MFEGIKKHLESLPEKTLRLYVLYYVITLGFVMATIYLATHGSPVVALSIIPLNILMYKAYYFVFDYFNSRSELNKLRAEGL